MDSADVCRVLNITKRTLQSYRDKGILPYTRIGGKFFYRESDLADYLERRTVKNNSHARLSEQRERGGENRAHTTIRGETGVATGQGQLSSFDLG